MKLVLVVGPDGTGKSSLFEELRRLHPGYTPMHFRTGPLLKPRDGDGTAPLTSPHPRGLLISAVKLCLIVFDHIASSWIFWRHRDVVVWERGLLDACVDTNRYRLPRSLTYLVPTLARLVRRPDLVVLLCGDAATIHARKPELSEDEIRRQVNKWRTVLARYGAPVIEIDTTCVEPARCAALVDTALADSARIIRVGRVRIFGRGDFLDLARLIYRPATVRGQLVRWVSLRRGATMRRRPRRLPSVVRDYLLARPTAAWACVADVETDRYVMACARPSGLTIAKLRRSGDARLAAELFALDSFRDSQPAYFNVPTLVDSGTVSATDFVETAVATGSPMRPSEIDLAKIRTLVESIQAQFPFSHGDLAPWNVLTGEDSRLIVLDWEWAEQGRPAYYDLIHFAIQIGALWRASTPVKTCRELLEIFSDRGDRRALVLASINHYLKIDSRPKSEAETTFARQIAVTLEAELL